jgi:two-component system OmpR family response regulator
VKALLVEDSRELRTVLRKALEQEGYAVDEAEDGAAGSFAARTNEYDVVILDNELPRKPGLLVCQEVRQAGRTMPILMLSVRSDAVEKAAHIDAGADDYVAKPFSFEELKSRLRALTRRPRAIQMPTVSLGDVTIDSSRFRVEVAGEPVYLARREFALLEHLLRHAGQVVTRADLIERVWESSVSPFSNTVESHVLSVRRKLGDAAKLIKSVPGRGYMADDKTHVWERPLPSERRRAAAQARPPRPKR